MDWRVSLVILAVIGSFGQVMGNCPGDPPALGMKSGEIKNSSLTSSSALPGHEAIFGRLDSENNRWAWCPANPIDIDSYEWIQVDFEEMVTISLVQIGGEFNDGEGTKFVTKLRIEYQRGEDDGWQQWSLGNIQEFDGITNARDSKYLQTNSKLLATRVRIIPISDVRREACLRLEFFGCRRNGVASYSAPQGDTRSDLYNFIDTDYDRKSGPNGWPDGRLTGGLGLLTNMRNGGDPFNATASDWLGWSNDVHSNVELIFEMDHLRNISYVKFYTYNNFERDVRAFTKATIYVSTGDSAMPSEPFMVFDYPRENIIYRRFNTIRFGHVLARFMKIVLEFDAKWIMISEVEFGSEIVSGQYLTTAATTRPAPVTSATTRKATTTPAASAQDVTLPFIPRVVESTTSGAEVIVNANPTTSPENANLLVVDVSLIGIIVGSCLGAILVVIFIIIGCCIYQRRKMSSTPSDASAESSTTTSIPPVHKTQHGENSEYDLPWGSRPLPHPPPNGATMQSSGYASDSNGWPPYASIPVDQYSQQLTPISPACLHHYMTSGGILTLPGIHHNRHQCDRSNNTMPNALNGTLMPMNIKNSDGNQYDLVQQEMSPYDSSNYRATPTVPLPNIQSSTGSSVYGVPSNSLLDHEIPRIPYESLRLLEKIGSGQYGEVHLCQMTVQQEDGEQTKLVAMKKLQSTAGELTKSDFMREIKIMSKLRHPNIIQVLGICSDSANSSCVVTEYMSKGDLNQVLQNHVPEGTALLNKPPLSQSTLLYITTQIALGMSYLEQLNVTHRDLAARNCLVGDNYQVKISDFGMSRNLYSKQYYKVEGRVVLPIRWMAWESVLLGKFTTMSDVWSFGVTLWEIFSFAREQPFMRLSDDDVISNCMNYYNNKMADVIVLPQPSQCSKKIYELMLACWNHDDFNRPTFENITTFLRGSPLGQPMLLRDQKMSMTRLTTC
ncbi:discoidin domain-containing receptor 2-like [Watersipora subatra]|uniref:discoidin domain-containing receptor 2-like n=1 Tax=Watersipora subatra TaxID=2589382 RepID=UPI00355C5C47